MANLSIHPISSDPVERGTRVGGTQSPVGAILQRLSRDEDERRFTVRGFIKALVIGVGSGVITSVVFQELFLVRMP